MKKISVFDIVMRLVWLLPAAAVLAAVAAATVNLKNDQGEQGREQLENAVRRAALTCYTVEGVYPPNVEYLEDNYGLQIDGERYAVFYSAFAENLMPDITVLEKSV